MIEKINGYSLELHVGSMKFLDHCITIAGRSQLAFLADYLIIVSALPTGRDAKATQPSATPFLAGSELTLSPAR